MADNLVEFGVSGMHCNNCALGVEKLLIKLGATNVNVNFSSSSARFTLPKNLNSLEVQKQIEGLGYTVTTHKSSPEIVHDTRLRNTFLYCLAFTLPLLLPMWVPLHALHNPYLQWILATPVVLVGIRRFGGSALRSLKARFANMDVLIIVGVVASYAYSVAGVLGNLGEGFLFFETAATITTIVLLGNLLEERAVQKTTTAVRELHALRPTTAKRLVFDDEGKERVADVSTGELKIGDILLVNTGDGIPVDGEVSFGECSVDESMITGESLPKEKMLGDSVSAGTAVVHGSVRIRAKAVGDDTMLSKIISLVQDAQARKPRIQRIGDSVSAVFVPTVFALALFTFIGSIGIFAIPWGEALLRSIAVLVIACPCAMGLATPTAVMVGIGMAAKRGILLKGGDTLETLANLKTVVFDKTGTLTTGRFSIKKLETADLPRPEVLSLLRSLSQRSSHPISQSIFRELQDAPVSAISEFEEIRGLGVRARDSDGRLLEFGGVRLLRQHTQRESPGTVFLFRDSALIATIFMEDQLRERAQEAINSLHAEGLRTVLLSGDTNERCAGIAQTLSIKTIHSEMLPEAKLKAIAQYNAEGVTAFVGDGINDAPALAEATLGVSLSGATNAALQSSQVILLDAHLDRLPEALGISKKTLRVIKQNLFWAFFYNVLALPLAMFGLLNPMVAALSMTFSDLFVIGNSLRLKLRH